MYNGRTVEVFTKDKVVSDANPFPVSGQFAPGGLEDGVTTTVVPITTVATPIPAIAFSNRKTFLGRVWGTTGDVVYVGGASVTTANGMPFKNEEFIFADTTDATPVQFYAVVASGTSSIRTMEIA